MVVVNNATIADASMGTRKIRHCLRLSNSGSIDFSNHGHIVTVSTIDTILGKVEFALLLTLPST